MQTLSELSQNLRISKSGLTLRINKIPNFRKQYCERRGNRLFIFDDGIKLINYQKTDSLSKHFRTRKGQSRGQLTSTDKTEMIRQLIHLNNSLERQNRDLRKDIEEVRNRD